MTDLITRLTETVQTNCHISDARHGADYGMCVYLMRMREYFRWEKGHAFSTRLDQCEIGDWLTDRESLWDELVDGDYHPIELNGQRFDAFDEAAINTRLRDYGLVYGGGLVTAGKPQFFLARLEDYEQVNGADVYVAGRELARGLSAFPAMSRGSVILLRREALERMVWEKLETWRWSRPENALGRAFASDDFEHDLDGALQRMASGQSRFVLLHECGEHFAGQLLGPDWESMLLLLAGTRAELMLRAVRDFVADCHGPLSAMPDAEDDASIHFYIGGLSNMRKHLFPALLGGYDTWRDNGDRAIFSRLATHGLRHWRQVAEDALDIYRRGPDQAEALIADMLEQRRMSRILD